ncbi:hypothetical protein ABW19_dt0209222 [Dactylella cylindrospora]|nr:hypothetical protein ABW19_dt0209222 [Dactylella cylindrospora]
MPTEMMHRRLPLELEYAILDHATFLDFTALRSVCRAWDHYLGLKNDRNYYDSRVKMCLVNPINRFEAKVHKLLTGGGLGFAIRVLPGSRWEILGYYLRLERYLEMTGEWTIWDIVQRNMSEVLASKAPKTGRPTCQISYPSYFPADEDTPSITTGIYLQFEELPCANDVLFDPGEQPLKIFSTTSCSIESGKQVQASYSFHDVASRLEKWWNWEYGRRFGFAKKISWTFRSFVDLISSALASQVAVEIDTIRSSTEGYSSAQTRILGTNGENADPIFLELAGLQLSAEIMLPFYFYRNFTVTDVAQDCSTA